MTTSVAVISYRTTSDTSLVFDYRLSESTFSSLEEARKVGEEKRLLGMCVIIRPLYNEEDTKGRFFREWVSFNGGKFVEQRWSY